MGLSARIRTCDSMGLRRGTGEQVAGHSFRRRRQGEEKSSCSLYRSALNHWYSTNMDTTAQAPQTANARSLLLPYALTLTGAVIVVQLVIALTGGEVTILAGVLTAFVAIGIATWAVINRRRLLHVRFGLAIAHVIAYVAVTTSFNLHAVIRVMLVGGADNGAQGVAEILLGSSWFGATLVMSGVWGLGLLVHLLGSVLGRGWED